eukprot:363609-Chlamydomonas_euryale.AAC.8
MLVAADRSVNFAEFLALDDHRTTRGRRYKRRCRGVRGEDERPPDSWDLAGLRARRGVAAAAAAAGLHGVWVSGRAALPHMEEACCPWRHPTPQTAARLRRRPRPASTAPPGPRDRRRLWGSARPGPARPCPYRPAAQPSTLAARLTS